LHINRTSKRDEITLPLLKDSDIVIICGPRIAFHPKELQALNQYVQQGGSLLIQIGERAEHNYKTNINTLLQDYGISVNSDSVIRTVFYKYFHPKEICIQNGLLNRGFVPPERRRTNQQQTKQLGMKNRLASKFMMDQGPSDDAEDGKSGLTFVFPYGCTLNVEKPAIPVLSSGSISYPLNRPVGAVYSSTSGGRVMVLGSTHLFHDDWLEKEENQLLQETIFRWLMRDPEVKLHDIDAQSPEVADYYYLPDSKSLAEKIKPCLQESEDLPKDFTTLFDDRQFKFDTNLIPEAARLYKDLHVKHEPLTLIPPAFETPLPPLNPAAFPPIQRDMAPPALDLFDLDEHFASEEVRLAHLTNRCKPTDIEYFVQKAGSIAGINPRLKKEIRNNPKYILEFMFRQIVQFKKSSPDNIPTGSI